MADKNQQQPERDVAAEVAAAKQEAEASAEAIIAAAKVEAEKIIADAKEAKTDDEVISRGVSRKDIVKAYDSGMSHMEIARKFYGSVNDDNMQKVIKVIDEEFEPLDNIDPEVQVVDAWS